MVVIKHQQQHQRHHQQLRAIVAVICIFINNYFLQFSKTFLHHKAFYTKHKSHTYTQILVGGVRKKQQNLYGNAPYEYEFKLKTLTLPTRQFALSNHQQLHHQHQQ